ncbi:MAG TPA: cupin domain-containing protein [Acidimicrobiales bacterium]|jgi:mannose-6-phosphate isomerase-like protein (cupin superfamily)
MSSFEDDLRRSFMLAGYETSPYEQWVAEQGIPVVRGFSVPDLRTVELAHWDWLGGPASFVDLYGSGRTNDAYVAEIPPGGELNARRHLFELFVFVLSGQGATAVWLDDGPRHQFEWKAGSLFAVPLNAWYQHFNTSGDVPARFYAVTTAPLMLDLFHNREFLFDNPFRFTDRFRPDDEAYFSGEGRQHPGRIWETNFVPDVGGFALQDWSERGAGGRNAFFELADSTMCASVSEFPVGTYKKAHRHGPGAHIVVLSGKGYTLMWREGRPLERVDWKEGSVFVPPDMWFHQHFNVGAEPARYMPIRWGSSKYHMFNYLGITKDVKEGGDQIEYEDEDPSIRATFEAELAKNGVECRMPARTG